MWVNKAIYQELRDALTSATSIKDLLTSQLKALEVTNDWFRVRIGQLEHERAVMLKKYMGVDVPVPTIERVRDQKPNLMNEVPSFADVGDDEARRLKIDWDPETGQVVYGDTASRA